jgi:hypothetical protein
MTNADLQNHLQCYLELRRALGFEMRTEGRLLNDFATFLQERTPAEPLIAQAAIDWASSRGGATWQARRLSVARCFLVHLRAHLPDIAVPAPGIIPCGVRPAPYIYSEAQILALMNEARALKPTGSLRSHTYATLIGLLASCGLRPGVRPENEESAHSLFLCPLPSVCITLCEGGPHARFTRRSGTTTGRRPAADF